MTHPQTECNCIACTLRKMLGNETEDKLHVGVIEKSLVAEIMADKKAKGNAMLDIDQAKLNARRDWVNDKITEAEFDQKMADVHADRVAMEEKYEASHKAIWDKVMLELMISDTERDFQLDMVSGEVTTQRRQGETGGMYVR